MIHTHSAKPGLDDLCKRPDRGGITGFDMGDLPEPVRDVFSEHESCFVSLVAEEDLVDFLEDLERIESVGPSELRLYVDEAAVVSGAAEQGGSRK